MSSEKKYIEELKKHYDSSQRRPKSYFPTYKGHHALHLLLKSLEIDQKENIIIQPFTCVFIPQVIEDLGVQVLFCDINKDNLSFNLDKLKNLINKKTRAIILQNNYGSSPQWDEVRKMTKGQNIFLIEDFAQGFGGKYRGAQNGTLGDASFFSTQMNKVFSTGEGGCLLCFSKTLSQKIERHYNFKKPNFRENIDILIKAFFHLFPHKLQVFLKAPFFQYKDYSLTNISPKSFSKIQAFIGVEKLKRIEGIILKRKERSEIIISILKKHQIKTPSFILKPLFFISVPVEVHEKEAFLKKAHLDGISIYDWPKSALSPLNDSEIKKTNFRLDNCPVSRSCASRTISFPTHPDSPFDEVTFDFFIKRNHSLLVKIDE